MEEVKSKANYIGAPQVFKLELAMKQLSEAYPEGSCYLVGSSLTKPDWRDVDIRMILPDEEFQKLFPQSFQGIGEYDSRWLILTIAISSWLSILTNLPVDFQFQSSTSAERHGEKRRDAIGLSIIP